MRINFHSQSRTNNRVESPLRNRNGTRSQRIDDKQPSEIRHPGSRVAYGGRHSMPAVGQLRRHPLPSRSGQQLLTGVLTPRCRDNRQKFQASQPIRSSYRSRWQLDQRRAASVRDRSASTPGSCWTYSCRRRPMPLPVGSDGSNTSTARRPPLSEPKSHCGHTQGRGIAGAKEWLYLRESTTAECTLHQIWSALSGRHRSAGHRTQ